MYAVNSTNPANLAGFVLFTAIHFFTIRTVTFCLLLSTTGK